MTSPAIDASVGGLVWVRRRNGSWWPGRIMGLNELSEDCLVSPRSGTPVKLLGREDASIDWYSLEKSKRVKAFRCGEYDECIEKAKAAAANSCRKTVKYARREDAILHALELENARMGKGCMDLSCRGDTSSSDNGISTIKPSPMSDSSEEEKGDANHLDDSSESARELSRSGLSFEEPNHVSSFKLQSEQGSRRRTPNDSEDDGTEGVKRMKGLEDLGMNVLSKGEDKEGYRPELVQLEHVSDFDAGKCISNTGCKVSSSIKRKRSQVPNVHECLKRKNRRRPLTKLLESTVMVSVPVACDEILMPCNSPPQGLSDGRIPGVEFSESKMSLSTVNNDKSDSIRVGEDNSSDRLFDVPFVGDAKHSAVVSGKQSSQSSEVETVCLGNEVPNESGSTSSAAAHGDSNLCIANERGASEWQSKGKRNSRNKEKKQESIKYRDGCDEANTNLAGTELSDICSRSLDQKVNSREIGESLLNSCALLAKPKKKLDDGFQKNKLKSIKETHMRDQTEPKQLPEESLMPQRLLPYRQSRFSIHSRFQTSEFSVGSFCYDASLYNVKIETRAISRPQHVPVVSLMSKFNGKAIVGHPLTTEILHDGVCDQWFNRLQCDLKGEEARPSSRSRRTRVKPWKMQPGISHRKSCKRKKATAQMSKKIRRLSSFTGQKHFKDSVMPTVEKPKGGHVISCIPLKVVFSRLNEAFSGLMTSPNQ